MERDDRESTPADNPEPDQDAEPSLSPEQVEGDAERDQAEGDDEP